MTRVVCDFLHDASNARSRNRMRQRKQKLYRLNRPLQSYDIFGDVHDSRKRVVGLFYTKQFVS